ncbi:MAG: PilN domain-containing protein [Gemmatimonadota bacterium]|jgi:hypothetical protein
MAGGNGKRIGVALGTGEVTAVVLGKKKTAHARVPVALDPESQDSGPELERAASELKIALEASAGESLTGAEAFFVLLPPLADARLVPFPASMHKSEVQAVLGRDVARYFLGAKRPRVVAARLPRVKREKGRSPIDSTVQVLAAASPLSLLEGARSAFERVGWEVRSFSIAHQAWMAAAESVRGSPPTGVAAVVGTTAHVLNLDGGDPTRVRRFPLSDPDALMDVMGKGPGPVLVLAGSQEWEELNSALSRRGVTTIRDPRGWPGMAEATAARASVSGLELVPPSLAEERRAKTRRFAVRLGVAAAALLIATLAVNFWGAQRELASVRGERAAIREDVAPLLLARDSLDGLRTQVRSLEEIVWGSPVWTRSLVELTALLPENTYLTGFFASGDTVELEAAGIEAGTAIQALREAGLFEEVRLQGLVERELEEGETVEERFSLWARLPTYGEEGGVP